MVGDETQPVGAIDKVQLLETLLALLHLHRVAATQLKLKVAAVVCVKIDDHVDGGARKVVLDRLVGGHESTCFMGPRHGHIVRISAHSAPALVGVHSLLKLSVG